MVSDFGVRLLRYLKMESDQLVMEDWTGWIERQIAPEDGCVWPLIMMRLRNKRRGRRMEGARTLAVGATCVE